MSTAIIFWSGTGNTEAMAKAIEAGMKEQGAKTELFEVSAVDAGIVDKYEKFAFGCPSMGAEVLEESEFEPFFADIEAKLSGKKVALFGSYGWGDGQWMRDWEARVKNAGATLCNDGGTICNETPDDAGLDACKKLGAALAEM